MSRPSILCVAGEDSGDRLLAPVMPLLRAAGYDPLGVGGARAVAAGLRTVGGHADALAAGGLVEAWSTVPAFLRAWVALRAALPGCRAALLVDFPELNLRLLRRARAVGVPVCYLAPPQAWAWRAWRAPRLRAATWVGCLLRFEADWYGARGVATEWVGHPLAERPPPSLAVGSGLALLPGSRAPAVRALLPVMLAAAARLRRGLPELHLHVGLARGLSPTWPRAALLAADLPHTLHMGASAALAASRVALCGAGTVTLQAALADRPFVALARLRPSSAAAARLLVRAEHVALPNLVLGRRAWPERVLESCTSVAVAEAARPLFDEDPRPACAVVRAACLRPGLHRRLVHRLVGR